MKQTNWAPRSSPPLLNPGSVPIFPPNSGWLNIAHPLLFMANRRKNRKNWESFQGVVIAAQISCQHTVCVCLFLELYQNFNHGRDERPGRRRERASFFLYVCVCVCVCVSSVMSGFLEGAQTQCAL